MEIFFLDASRKSSKRQQELQIAAARSHAARISYFRAKKGLKTRARSSCPAYISEATDGHTESSRSQHHKRVDFVQEGSIFPGFGSFRGELFDLLPKNARLEDKWVLDFFVEVTLPGTDVASEIFNSSGLFGFLLPNLIQSVSYHAIMSMIHLSSSIHCQPKVKLNPIMLEHRGRALEKVRILLDGKAPCSTEALVISIMCLSTVEGALGNIRSYRLHLSALKLLEQEKGHLPISPGQNVADMIALYSDTVLALKTGKSAFKRRCYEARYVRQPLPPKSQLNPGFTVLLQQMPLSQDTVAVLVNAGELGLSVPRVTLTHSQRMVLAGRRQMSRKYSNYLDSVPILLMPESADLVFEKMLVLALSLFAWCGFTAIRSPQLGMYQMMIIQLSKRLFEFQPDAEIGRKCIAWMWLLVVDAWRIGGSNGTVLSPGLDMLRQFHQRFSEYRRWDEVQGLTRLFFWTGDMEMFWSRRWDQLSCELLVTHEL